MELEWKNMASGGDRLSDLPDSILTDILSLLWDGKQVVRTCVLSTRWKSLWMSVPVSLHFMFNRSRIENNMFNFIAEIHRELYYWRPCQKIRTFELLYARYDKCYAKHFELWVHFATKVANVDHLTLQFEHNHPVYFQFPEFAYKDTSLKTLVLIGCQLNPSGIVNWTSLLSLSIGDVELTEGGMQKVLSGCPNLECLKLDFVRGIHRLNITSAKLRMLTLTDYANDSLEIFAPYIQILKLSHYCIGISFPRNVPSLVTAILHLDLNNFQFDEMEEKFSYLKELLHSLAHVQNLELGPWCIECLSIMELKGWQSPPSSRKFLKLDAALEELDLPGICSFLQSSLDLETLVIDWCKYKERNMLLTYANEDEQYRRFEMHNFNCSFLHLKTIKIINYHELLSGNQFIRSLVKYFLKNATVLEKFVISVSREWSDVSQDYVKMEQELLSFPRSSPHASVVLSY